MQNKTFKVASWNVNSIRSRLSHLTDWLADAQPDVLAVQETKVSDEQFPITDIEATGYQVLFSGQKSYNGVALLHRTAASDKTTTVDGINNDEKRVLVATINDIRIINLYVVNGAEVDSEHYQYKLKWLEHIHAFINAEMKKYPRLIVLGDFNITPSDADVHDPKKWDGHTLCTDAERHKLKTFFDLGLADTFRLFEQKPEHTYSWWDYRKNSFGRNAGLRIDLLLASPTLCECCLASTIDKRPRSWEQPSDHTPIIAEFKLL